MQKNNPRSCVQDLAKALREVFRKYSLGTRKESWDVIRKGKGEKEVQNILNHPGKPLNRFQYLAIKEDFAPQLPKWHIWDDGLTREMAEKILRWYNRKYKDRYEFRIIKSPFHADLWSIEGCNVIK